MANEKKAFLSTAKAYSDNVVRTADELWVKEKIAHAQVQRFDAPYATGGKHEVPAVTPEANDDVTRYRELILKPDADMTAADWQAYAMLNAPQRAHPQPVTRQEKPVVAKMNLGHEAGVLAGHSIGFATVGLNAAAAVKAQREGRDDEARQYAAVAVQAAGMEMAFTETGMRTGLKAAEVATGAVGFKAAALAVKGVGTKVPVVGAVVGGAFRLAETGYEIYKAGKGESNWKKVVSTAGSGVIDTVSGVFGFLGLGAGEAAHEGWRAGTEKMFGQHHAARHGALVELGSMAATLVSEEPAKGKPAGKKPTTPALSKFELEIAQAAKLDKNHDGRFDALEVSVAKAMAEKLHALGISLQSADKDRNGDISPTELGNALRNAKASQR